MNTLWPRWYSDKLNAVNLREVHPGLFVGGEVAPRRPPQGRWALVVDLCGRALEPGAPYVYERADMVLPIPFQDATPFPSGALDQIVETIAGLSGDGPVLVQCRAGLSRSASAAYALLRQAGVPDAEAVRRVTVDASLGYPHPVVLNSARAWVDRRR